jgi:hypothetical protein
VILTAWFALINLEKEKASSIEVCLASVIYFVCCIPVLISFGRSKKAIPYLPVLGIIYFIFYSLPIFNAYDLFIIEGLSRITITRCLYLSLWGFVSLLLAFYTPLGNMADLIKKRIDIPWDDHKAYWLGVSLGFMGLVFQYFNLGKFLPPIFNALTVFVVNLSRLGIAVLFILQLHRKLNFRGKVFLWFGLFIPKASLDLITGSVFHLVIDFMIIFFLYFYYRRSIPWVRLIVGSLILFVIFSARDQYRKIIWFDDYYRDVSSADKAALYFKLIFLNLSGQGEKQEVQKYTYDKLSARTNSLITFVKTVELTPAYVPYWKGYTYSTLLTTFAPRFLMPNKPEKKLGQEFGHRYMLLHDRDLKTAYNLPILVEMYINFGPWGVIIGMFIFGLICRIIHVLFDYENIKEGSVLISTLIFVNILNIESDFSLVFGAIVQYAVLFYFIAKMMRPSRRVRIA